MSLITLHPAILSVHGKAGDIVFVKRKGVRFIRKHVIPRDPKTLQQRKNRVAFARCVAMWQDLPPCFKDSWNRCGKTLNRTGYNLFISESMKALAQGSKPKPVKIIHQAGYTQCITRAFAPKKNQSRPSPYSGSVNGIHSCRSRYLLCIKTE